MIPIFMFVEATACISRKGGGSIRYLFETSEESGLRGIGDNPEIPIVFSNLISRHSIKVQ